MLQFLLFLIFSGLTVGALALVSRLKKIPLKSILGLVFFGILISIPFLMVEYLALHLKYYLVILVFVAIESVIFLAENKIKYFHHLIHDSLHNLRIISFILIGLGFTYSEISFTIFKHGMDAWDFFVVMPFRILYSVLAHTVLASAASLARLSSFFAENIYETILKFVSYYARITVVSLSHYIYVFSHEHHLVFMAGLLTIAMVAFIYIKKHLDVKHLEVKAEAL